ncbi:MAG TPA: 5'-3' exonuclease H3TH domain-containing protein, partial [Phycisphaerales bacterium]|nr:5'-3' exonuclease H3TH domain-containing protein [Phycisphaerales bacterium]
MLYIIDGYAQFFRAYHAIRTPMTSPVTKEPTNMTFGFVGLLLRLLGSGGDADRSLWDRLGGKPDHVAVALDVSGDRGTFRSRIYPEYKATRAEPPEDLEPQVRRCLALLEAIGVPVLGVEGFEADDVIATVVTMIRRGHPDVAVRMVSKDKDLKQLLDEPAQVPDPSNPALATPGVALVDIHAGTITDAAALREQTGLRPSQVIDMLTLMGDTVDNVPGVSGVGEKTAAKLIAEHGSLDALLSHADQLKGKQAENVKAAIPHLGISRELITLRHDVPVLFDLSAASASSFRLERLLPILKELGFNRYQDDVRTILSARGVSAVYDAGSTHPGISPKARPQVLSTGTNAGAGGARASRSRKQADGFGGLFEAMEQDRSPDAPSVISPAHAGPPTHADHGNPRDQAQIPAATEAISGRYTCVRTREELDALVRRLHASPALAIDTETTSLAPHDADLCGISVAVVPGEAYYIPIRSPEPARHLDEKTILEVLAPVLTDPARSLYAHNLKYDLLVLRRAGVAIRLATKNHSPRADEPAAAPTPCDTMVASYLIDSSRSSHSLDAL